MSFPPACSSSALITLPPGKVASAVERAASGRIRASVMRPSFSSVIVAGSGWGATAAAGADARLSSFSCSWPQPTTNSSTSNVARQGFDLDIPEIYRRARELTSRCAAFALLARAPPKLHTQNILSLEPLMVSFRSLLIVSAGILVSSAALAQGRGGLTEEQTKQRWDLERELNSIA